jgi:hypothetical protein
MITDGFGPTPLELWDWGIPCRSGALRLLTIDEVSLEVMPRDTALITPKGIRFKNAYYKCDTATREDWFSLARRRSSRKIEVSYDLRKKEVLYIRDGSLPQGFEACTLLPEYLDCAGKSHAETEELARAQKIQQAATADRRQERRIETKLQIKEIIKGAEKRAETMKGSSLSKSERLSIRKNRAKEKAARRRDEAIDLAFTAASFRALNFLPVWI